MKFITGNILDSDAQALVNTVNTMGIMGKGIALQFKEKFPTNFKLYASACKKGEVMIGKMFVVKENTLSGEKIIINFPTKTTWKKSSEYDYIENGLIDLVEVIKQKQIKSIALPPLGCGYGGLNWTEVKQLINKHLGQLEDVDIQIFEPNEDIKKILQKESLKKDIALTPVRAMLLYALFYYEKHGEPASVFVANKLAYFLNRIGEPMKLEFISWTFGPYAQAIEKVLYALNGKYLKGLEQMSNRPFEPLLLNYDRYLELDNYVKSALSDEQKQRLKDLFKVIDGFETALSLETLASIDFLKHKNPNITESELLNEIQNWNKRKKETIKKEYISIAIDHLENYSKQLKIA